jgi:Lrp/AsnC family transcriptional regulator
MLSDLLECGRIAGDNFKYVVIMKFSDQERTLLARLQADASLSLADLAEAVGMATSTVWRKVQEFEAVGLIRGRVALLDPARAGLKLCIFATVTLKAHDDETVQGFARVVATHPEILEAHSISGNADYILKIRAADVETYEGFLSHVLLRSGLVASVHSSFSLKELKYSTALPL